MDHSKLSLSTSGLGANSKVIFSELSVHDDLIKLSYTDEISAAGPSALDNKLDPFILNLGGDIRGNGMLRSTTKLSRNLKAEASMYRGTTTEGDFFLSIGWVSRKLRKPQRHVLKLGDSSKLTLFWEVKGMAPSQ
jgi:hypothetical protein